MFVGNITKGQLAFVVGSGRSGTTLLTKLLNSHTDIMCPTTENSFLISFLFRFKNHTSFTQKEIDLICDNLWVYKSVNKHIWNIDYNHLKTTLSKAKDSLNYETLLKVIIAHFGGNTTKDDFRYYMDKNPFYLFYLNDFSKIFPQAKYLFIIRDYRGRYNSIQKVRGIKSLAYGISWNNQQKMILSHINHHPNHCHLLFYENLVTQPEQELKKICEFLNVDFQPSMLEHHQISKVNYETLPVDEKLKENQLKWHGNSDNPINTKSLEKWKAELSPQQIKVLDYFCNDTGKLLGYPPVYTSFSLKEKLLTEVKYRPLFILIYSLPRLKKLFMKLPVAIQKRVVWFLKQFIPH